MSLEEKILNNKEKRAAERLGLIRPNKEELFREFIDAKDEREQLKKERAEQDRRTSWLEIADRLAQSLTKYAAARKGVDKGIDLSKLDIEGTDWDKVRARADKRYREDVGDVEKREREIGEILSKNIPRQVRGVMQKDGMPAYITPGIEGYTDKDGRPVEVIPYEKKKELPDIYRTSLIEDKSLITESGAPVYKKITTNKRNPGEITIELTNEVGEPLTEKHGPKAGLDAKSVLSNKEATALAAAESSLEMLKIIETDKPKYDTGPISNFFNWIGQKTGFDDADTSAFKANVQDTLNRYIKEMTGAQMSESEAERLMAAMPKFSDDDKTFQRKLEETKRRIKLYDDQYKKKLLLRDKKIGEPEKQSGPVKMRRKSDGKIFIVPAQNVDKALQGGYERAD